MLFNSGFHKAGSDQCLFYLNIKIWIHIFSARLVVLCLLDFCRHSVTKHNLTNTTTENSYFGLFFSHFAYIPYLTISIYCQYKWLDRFKRHRWTTHNQCQDYIENCIYLSAFFLDKSWLFFLMSGACNMNLQLSENILWFVNSDYYFWDHKCSIWCLVRSLGGLIWTHAS